MNKRITQVATIIFVVIGLFVSSLSACACSHHLTIVENETASCHPSSHHGDANESVENAGSKSIQSPCECIVKTPSPVIAGKSGNKVLKPQKELASAEIVSPSFDHSSLPTASPVAAKPAVNIYLSALPVGSQPARAPPRL